MPSRACAAVSTPPGTRTTPTAPWPTGCAPRPWARTRGSTCANVDDIITVSEDGIRSAVRHLAVAGRLVAEPSGAVTTAAWLERDLPSGRTAAIVSGGSIDPDLLAQVLRTG